MAHNSISFIVHISFNPTTTLYNSNDTTSKSNDDDDFFFSLQLAGKAEGGERGVANDERECGHVSGDQ